MTDEEKIFYDKLKNQLEPIMNDLAKTHTEKDTIRIDYPVGGILILFNKKDETV